MVRRIAIIFIFITLFALLGVGYLQFSSDTAWVAVSEVKKNKIVTEEDLQEISFAKLRDQKTASLLIANKAEIIGKYATMDIPADSIFINNGMLSDTPPAGRCFPTGRCLPEGYTAWMFVGDEFDTLGDTVTADDLLDIVLVDTLRKQVTILVQKAQPLDKNETSFVFAFTPEQVAILDGIRQEQTDGEETLHLALQLNQYPNPPQALLQRYSMDYTSIRPDLFTLPPEETSESPASPTPTPTPGMEN